MKECDFNEMWHDAGPYQSPGEEGFPWGEWEKEHRALLEHRLRRSRVRDTV